MIIKRNSFFDTTCSKFRNIIKILVTSTNMFSLYFILVDDKMFQYFIERNTRAVENIFINTKGSRNFKKFLKQNSN